MSVLESLMSLKDENYAEFQSRLMPTVDPGSVIGVRVPLIRKLAGRYTDTKEADDFLNDLPHKYYDENMLHGVMISLMKDYDKCIKAVDEFLPYVDNWAVCDILSPKVFKKNKDKLIYKITQWSSSDKTYTCRFGIEMLMSHYLDDDFKTGYLKIPANIVSDEYYVNMMLAWFFATALAKQWDSTVEYIESGRLPLWVHNKTIQKACESFRISDEQKNYLRSLKNRSV